MKRYLFAAHVTLFFMLLVPVNVYASFSVQVGSFKAERNAGDLVEKLNNNGFFCEASEVDDVVKVMCGEFASRDDAVSLKKDLEGKGFSGFITKAVTPSVPADAGASSIQVVPSPFPPGVVAAGMSVGAMSLAGVSEDEVEEESSSETMDDMFEQVDDEDTSTEVEEVIGSTTLAEEVEAREKLAREAEPDAEGGISGDILEEGVFFIHPFFSVAGIYTDNLYNTKEDRESDSGYIVSPGVWASIPASRSIVTQTSLSVGAPGGRAYSTMDAPIRRRFSANLYYRGDAEEYSKNEEQGTVSHTGEANLSYDTLNWVAVSLSAQYLRSHEERSYLGFGERGIYEAKRAGGKIVLGSGKKVSLSLGHVSYGLEYINDDDKYRERSDKIYNGQLSFLVKPKTNIVVGYQQSEIEYKKEEYIPGSTEKSYYAGIMWDLTSKTRGIIRAGQSTKEFDEDFKKINPYMYDLDDRKTTIAEIQIRYTYSPKSNITFSGSKAWRETDMVESAYIHSYMASFGIAQRITYKTSVNLDVSYQKDTYEGDIVIGIEIGERVDRFYVASVAFQYDLTRLHSIGLGYTYKKRDSNFDAIDYYTNTFFLRLTASL